MEIARILSPGGAGLIYVWAMEQKRGEKKSSYLKQNKHNKKDKISENIHNNKTEEINSCKNNLHLKNNEESLPSFRVHKNRTQFIEQDMFVPWKVKPQSKGKSKNSNLPTCVNDVKCNIEASNNEESIENKLNDLEIQEKSSEPIFHRFYHVFREGELIDLCSKISNLEVKHSYYDEGNWCILFEKNKIT